MRRGYSGSVDPACETSARRDRPRALYAGALETRGVVDVVKEPKAPQDAEADGSVGLVEGYVEGLPEATRAVFAELRELVRAAIPGARETMAYGIPTFDLHGKHVVHVAGYAGHVGLYPTPSGLEAFQGELAPYRSGKGTARFVLGAPLPADLIRRVVAFRVAEVEAAAKARRAPAPAAGPV